MISDDCRLYGGRNLDTLIETAYKNKTFPGAVCVVGNSEKILYKKVIGYSRTFSDDNPCLNPVPANKSGIIAANYNTLWDMASLSKLIGTTMCALKLIEKGKITLPDTIGMYFDAPEDKKYITIAQLMTHTSGISAHFRLDGMGIDNSKAAEAILNHPLAYETGAKVEYSCMGFILLGKIIESVYGASLDVIANELVFEPLDMNRTCYNPLKKGITSDKIAATEYSTVLGRYICGEVHDENARFLSGISGNAGIFSCAGDCVKFAEMLSRHGDGYMSRSLFDCAITNRTSGMNGGDENRGLGFQLLGENEFSAMGDVYSIGSYGHNGFTGPSIYVDYKTGLYTIFLTNRVHFTRESSLLFRFRRLLHNTALTSFY